MIEIRIGDEILERMGNIIHSFIVAGIRHKQSENFSKKALKEKKIMQVKRDGEVIYEDKKLMAHFQPL